MTLRLSCTSVGIITYTLRRSTLRQSTEKRNTLRLLTLGRRAGYRLCQLAHFVRLNFTEARSVTTYFAEASFVTTNSAKAGRDEFVPESRAF